jgi:hypothetical protein
MRAWRVVTIKWPRFSRWRATWSISVLLRHVRNAREQAVLRQWLTKLSRIMLRQASIAARASRAAVCASAS